MADRAHVASSLLFGLTALRAHSIGADELLVALGPWLQNSTASLSRIMVEQGILNKKSLAKVGALVNEQLNQWDAQFESGRGWLDGCSQIPDCREQTSDHEMSVTQSHAGAAKLRDPQAQNQTTACSDGRYQTSEQRFQVVRQLARGGLGTIFIAHDEGLDREVALKQIQDHRADDPTSRSRFLLEARITGALEHPGIVPIYALGADNNGRPYYAMRLIKGKSLKQVIEDFHADRGLDRKSGAHAIELRKLLRHFLDVCNAVEYAHGRGVLHRDLKPSNIMVGAYGETLVVDWGLAKLLARAGDFESFTTSSLVPGSPRLSAETLPGSKIGTPEYMSPEQAAGELEQIGPAADIYGLGATLYFLLTGKTAIQRGNQQLALEAARTGEFVPPRAIDPSIPRALESVCLKAMALRPEDRYRSSLALAVDLERWMADEPVSALSEPMTERARRWVRRHRTASSTVAASFLVAMLGLLAIMVILRRSNWDLMQSNVRLNQANTELLASRDRERTRFDLAMESIKKFHTGVTEDFLLQQKQFEPLRTKLLTEARDSYAKLRALLAGQTDRHSRALLVKALLEFGRLTRTIGSKEEALTIHEQSLAICRELASTDGSQAEDEADEGRILLAIGVLQGETGVLDEAIKSIEHARTIFDALVHGKPAMTTLQRELANCHNTLAFFLKDKGMQREAVASFERSLTIMNALARTDPREFRFQSDIAAIQNNIAGLLEWTSKPDEALEWYERAKTIEETLVKEKPKTAAYAHGLAKTLINIGDTQVRIAKPVEAIKAYERARAILATLTEQNPNVTQFQSDLARTHNGMGSILSESGKTVEALASFEQAKVIREDLVRNNPKTTQFQGDLAASCNNIGNELVALRKPTEAIESFHRGQAILQELVKANTDLYEYHDALALSHHNLANLQVTMDKRADALASFEQARSIWEDLIRRYPSHAQFGNSLATSLGIAGLFRIRIGEKEHGRSNLRAALAIMQSAPTQSSAELYNQACFQAILSSTTPQPGTAATKAEAREDADRAMIALRRVVASGFKAATLLRTDSDLNCLRSRADFQCLLMDAEFPTEPFAR
jgi:eukaryotic-like serine/threonine-protein kinase